MITRRFICVAVLVAAPVPAVASITVLGATHANACFRAADSDALPSRAAVDSCDAALAGENLTPRDTVATHVNRGILRLRRNDPVGAMADFDVAMRLDPAEPEAYLNRGSVLIRQEQVEPALAMFNAALERNTTRPALAYYGRGVAHEAMGRMRDAYSDYVRASELAPRWGAPREDLSRFRVVR